MSEPKIEYKRERPTTISLLESKLARAELRARDMLQKLEVALVRCGYTRDCLYNSRHAGYTGRGEKGVVLHWKDGQILIGRGLARGDNGKVIKPFRANMPATVKRMTARDLALIARHLSPFVDALENNVRHQLEELQKATETIQGFIDRIEADPMPSDTPAQMSEDPEVEMPEEALE
jgi:hypothetical protein